MPAASPKPFRFLCGSDDYLVGRIARERHERDARGMDEFSREVISGHVGNIGELEVVIRRFREAVQTLGLFGGRRAVWLKDVNFLADTVTGRAEGTLKLVDDLRELLERIDPADVAVVVSAAPVDRRRSFPKWCEAHGDFELVGESGGRGGASIDWGSLATEELSRWDVVLAADALELLVGKTAGNARLFIGELQKLATYLGEDEATITPALVEALVPAFGEGDFFEAAEAFFARDLPWALDAVRRHFFAGHDARPLLSSFQNRNRLLIQVRALMLGGEVSVGPRGVDKVGLERAAGAFGELYGEAAAEKSNLNVFTQNPWYLGKLLGPPGRLPGLRALIDHQLEFARAFEGILSRPREQEEVVRGMVIRCLA